MWHGSATLHGTLQPCPPFLLAWHRLVSRSVSCARLGRSDAARLHWAFPDGLLWQNVVKGNPSTFAVLQSAHSPAALSCPKRGKHNIRRHHHSHDNCPIDCYCSFPVTGTFTEFLPDFLAYLLVVKNPRGMADSSTARLARP